MDIKDLFRKDGKLNSAIIRREWFKTSPLLLDIQARTQSFVDATLAERIFIIQHDIVERPKCLTCKVKTVEFSISLPYRYLERCVPCAYKETAKKRVATCRRMYGTGASPKTIEAARQRAPELNRKGRATLKDRWGVINPGQLPHVKLAMSKHHQDPAFKERSKRTRQKTTLECWKRLCDKVEVHGLLKERDPVFLNQCSDVSFTCKDCSTADSLPTETFKWRSRQIGHVCTGCSGISCGSAEQKRLYDEILKLAPDALISDRKIIHPYEIDIYVPSAKLGIEYHGIFWHSQADTANLARDIHVHKIARCEARGVQLLQFSSLELPVKVLSIIRHKLGLSTRIFARKTKIIELAPSIANALLDGWHLKGGTSCRLAWGLEVSGEVIATMTFGTNRFERKRGWELIRFASKPGVAVIGGASKLLNAFENAIHPKEVTSFADRFISNGRLYEELGFKIAATTPPNYFYWNKKTTLSRYQAQKHKLPKILGDKFDDQKTEIQNMLANDWRIFYDAGSLKYIKTP
jgi:hypothetical protein